MNETYNENYKNIRDRAITFLWLIFRNHSEVVTPEEFNQEDLDIWYTITKHSSIQGRLEGARKH